MPINDGEYDPNTPGADATLNIQIAQGMACPTPQIFWSIGGQTVPPDYATSVCDLFAELGLRRVSVLTSSGSVSVGTGACVANDSSGIVRFLPRFPPSCTYVCT